MVNSIFDKGFFMLFWLDTVTVKVVIHCVAPPSRPLGLVVLRDETAELQHGCTKQLPCWYLRHCRSHVGGDGHVPSGVVKEFWEFMVGSSPCDGTVRRQDKTPARDGRSGRGGVSFGLSSSWIRTHYDTRLIVWLVMVSSQLKGKKNNLESWLYKGIFSKRMRMSGGSSTRRYTCCILGTTLEGIKQNKIQTIHCQLVRLSPRLLVNRVQMAEKMINKKKKRKNWGRKRTDSLSGQGREPESPLVVGTCKTWKSHIDQLLSTRQITLRAVLYFSQIKPLVWDLLITQLIMCLHWEVCERPEIQCGTINTMANWGCSCSGALAIASTR